MSSGSGGGCGGLGGGMKTFFFGSFFDFLSFFCPLCGGFALGVAGAAAAFGSCPCCFFAAFAACFFRVADEADDLPFFGGMAGVWTGG